MIKIAICDDENIYTRKIEQLLYVFATKEIIEIVVDIFYDGITLVERIVKGDRYDLVYLDIEMKTLNGVEVAKNIRKFDQSVLLIYISAYESYFKQLFEVEPFRFISKPINNDIFEEYFKKACTKINYSHTHFHFQFNKEIKSILVCDIIYFESCGRLIYVYLTTGIEKFYGKLNDIEKILQNGKMTFLRIHQSYYINYIYIKKINFSKVILVNGSELGISENRQKAIRLKFCALLGGDLFDK